MDDDVEVALNTLNYYTSKGFPLEVAKAKTMRVFKASAPIEQAVAIWQERSNSSKIPVLKDHRHADWYSGPTDHHTFWPAVRERISSRLKPEEIESIDLLTTSILNAMSQSKTNSFQDRGLVLGYVQSGKTTNFTALCAKAADSEYRLIIVLSGLTDSLREQTQERLDKELVGAESEGLWQQLTSVESDFVVPITNAANMLRVNPSPLLAVVKKNPRRLEKLLAWLTSAGTSVLANTPILLIDDEADQASVNTAKNDAISRINSLVRQIARLPRVSYVAYTATPFANLLIDPKTDDDLYPRTFVVTMPQPREYFGAEAVFGNWDDPDADPLDIVREVSAAECDDVTVPNRTALEDGWSPSLGAGIDEAIRWFLLSTAARRARSATIQHATMLIHTSMLSGAHFAMRDALTPLIETMHRAVTSKDASELDRLRKQYVTECTRVPAERFDHEMVPWEIVRNHLPGVLADVRLVVDNYISQDRLSYSETEPTVAIVIGGNTLSRGLTLEGLTSSYFVRRAKTYDTLMQMGRWFGYRKGYEDLCRIWLPGELADWFGELSEIEAEIREEIARYAREGLTPTEAGVRIRLHPDMAITAATKMRNATLASYSYSGERPQTTIFARTDGSQLRANLQATEELLKMAQTARPLSGLRPGLWGYDDVPTGAVVRLIENYKFHPDKPSLSASLLLEYINEELREGALQRWRIVVMGQDGAHRSVDLGLPEPVGLITRTRLAGGSDDAANIRALTAGEDHFDTLTADEWGARDRNEETYAQLRTEHLRGAGIIRLYVIDKDSPTKQYSTKRIALGAAEDVIGIAFDFPKSARSDGGATHVVAALPKFEPDWEQELAEHELDDAVQAEEVRAEATE